MSSTSAAASILASFSTRSVSMQPTKTSLEKQSDLQSFRKHLMEATAQYLYSRPCQMSLVKIPNIQYRSSAVGRLAARSRLNRQLPHSTFVSHC